MIVTVLVLVSTVVGVVGAVVVVVVSVVVVVVSLGVSDVVSSGVVVSGAADVSDGDSVTVCGGTTAGASDGVLLVVVVVVSDVDDESSPDASCTISQMISANSRAASAPRPTSAAGLRYHGVGGSSGGYWS